MVIYGVSSLLLTLMTKRKATLFVGGGLSDIVITAVRIQMILSLDFASLSVPMSHHAQIDLSNGLNYYQSAAHLLFVS